MEVRTIVDFVEFATTAHLRLVSYELLPALWRLTEIVLSPYSLRKTSLATNQGWIIVAAADSSGTFLALC
jgi:hypothetical protein